MSRKPENQTMLKTIVFRCSDELYDHITDLSIQKRRSKQHIVRNLIEKQLLSDNPNRNIQS